jgi:hypothetical protein
MEFRHFRIFSQTGENDFRSWNAGSKKRAGNKVSISAEVVARQQENNVVWEATKHSTVTR